ncbi:MAG: PTS sugar transporter subunit IIA [Planctomycetota bacterium]|jgi:mannitol/fructose-specific phosphotransferase system IIA component (Ntr-type)
MKLSDIICVDAIVASLESTDRDAVIKELVAALGETKTIKKKDIDALADAVVQRENEASTGIGKGVAVPHVKHDGIKDPIAAIGCSAEGIDFTSLDKQPVYSVFLLLSPADNPDKHLRAMETIFKNLQKDDFRRFLRQAQSVQDVTEAVKDADEATLE